MAEQSIKITLIPAGDDPRVNSPAFREELHAFPAGLDSAGVRFSAREMAFDSIDSPEHPVPEFLVTLGPADFPNLARACGAWVQSRSGRSVRIKVGDIETRVGTSEAIQKYLETMKAFFEL